MASRKLNKQQAREIFVSPEKSADLAERYGVLRCTVDSVRRGKTYRWATFGLEKTCKRGRPRKTQLETQSESETADQEPEGNATTT